MPMYDFKCSSCNHIFEELEKAETQELPCPKCGSISQKGFWTRRCPTFLFKGYIEKGKGKLDDGIPFGEVPGDEIYQGIGEPDYMGPMP